MKDESSLMQKAAEVVRLAVLVNFISFTPVAENLEHVCGETRRHYALDAVQASYYGPLLLG